MMDRLSLQDLIDYLHTAVSEHDLLFVYYWVKELEKRGKEGKEAIRKGQHSWKNENAMEAILKSRAESSEISRIVYEMLRLLGATASEELRALGDGGWRKERWRSLQAGTGAQAQATLLLSLEKEAAADWIDECGFAPPVGKLLTGWNPLPNPPSSASTQTISPSPVDRTRSTVSKRANTYPPRAKSHSRNHSSSYSFQSSTSPSSRSSKPTLAPLSSLPYSPASSHNLNSTAFNQSLLKLDPEPLIRIHSLPYLDSEGIVDQIMKDKYLFEKPESYIICQDTGKPASKDGFILLCFSSKMVARLAVVYLKTKSHRNIELETDYRERQNASSKEPSPSPYTRRNSAPCPPPSHKVELGEIYEDSPPLLRVASLSSKLPPKPQVCPAITQEDPRFSRSFKKSQTKEWVSRLSEKKLQNWRE